MERLKIRDAAIMEDLIRDKIHRNDESKYDHRLHGLLLVARGHTCSSVADLLDHSVKTIENWVNRFNKSGFNSLMDEPHTGRPPTLSKNQLSEIDKDIRLNPQSLGYSQNLWNGKLLSHYIFNKFEAHLSVRQCQRLFHNLGFRQKKLAQSAQDVIHQSRKILKKLTEKVQSRKHEIWSTDECHFHQHGSR